MTDDKNRTSVKITKQGQEELLAELDELLKVKLPKIVERVAIARAHGDLKENAEYQAAKEEQQLTEARIGEIQDILDRVVIVKQTTSHTTIGIGSQVLVTRSDQKNKRQTFHIVGEFEADPSEGKVSSSSPVGAALMGKKKGEIAIVKTPAGKVEWQITKVN